MYKDRTDTTSTPSLSFSEGTLVLEGWLPRAIEKVFPEGIWSWDDRVRAYRCSADHYPLIAKLIEERSTGTFDRVPHWQTVNWAKIDLPELRDEQTEAVAAWMKDRRNIVVMPTGTGKTEVALRIMAELRCSTLVVAPIRDLMYQWHRRILRGLDCDAGIVGDNVFNVKAVSVTTYDSACIHMPRFGNKFKLIIFDECHHLPGQVRQDAARMSIAPWRLGLTATLERNDGRHQLLNTLIGPVAHRVDIQQVRGKSLANFTVYRIPIHLTDDEQARYDSLGKEIRDFYYAKIQEDPAFTWEKLCSDSSEDPGARRALAAYRQKQAIEDRASEKFRILEDLFRLHQGSPMIIFAGSNVMARDVSRRFLIPCLLSHCGKKERLNYLEGLRDGIYPAIVANRVLDEGIDLPDVKVAVVIGGQASTKQAKQRLGRILRRSQEKEAVLYEVVAAGTNEEVRSRKRRASDAYSRTRHRRI